MKKLIRFSHAPQLTGNSKPVTFKESDGGFEADMVIFSTAYNRNRGFFQVTQLMKWENKLDRIMFNFNHNLNLSGGKYLGNQTKFIKLWFAFTDGEFEVWATMRTTDPQVIAKKDEITAPSIELMVDDHDICRFEDGSGEYYTLVDWVGCAILLGEPQGSGDARVVEIRDFNYAKIFNLETQTNNMNEEQIKQFIAGALDEQEKKLKKEFSEKEETMKKEFAAENAKIIKQFSTDIISASKSNDGGEYMYQDEDGNIYKTEWKSVYESICKMVANNSVEETDKPMMFALAKKFAAIFPAQTETQNILNQIDQADKNQAKKNFKKDELVVDRNDASNPADQEVKIPSFYSKLMSQTNK